VTYRPRRSRAWTGQLTATGPVTPACVQDRWGRVAARHTAPGEALLRRRRTRVRFPPPPPSWKPVLLAIRPAARAFGRQAISVTAMARPCRHACAGSKPTASSTATEPSSIPRRSASRSRPSSREHEAVLAGHLRAGHLADRARGADPRDPAPRRTTRSRPTRGRRRRFIGRQAFAQEAFL
jgi:hypothetical protein